MRWFLFGIVIAILVPLVMDVFIQYPAEIETLSFTAIPAGIGIAILRHQLFDIDVIIRKTLQYALLTGLLALTYFGGVVLLQGILGPLTGSSNSPLVTVVTTLGIIALFNPLRNRVQDFIDRRFFRKKYNAEKALAQFAAVARDEVDMEKLTTALLGLVEETIQPEQVSLWIVPPKDGRRRAKG